MKIRMLLGAAHVFACVNPGCAGGTDATVASPTVSASLPCGGSEGRGAVAVATPDDDAQLGGRHARDALPPSQGLSLVTVAGQARRNEPVGSLRDTELDADRDAREDEVLADVMGDADAIDAGAPLGPLPMYGAITLQHVRDFARWREVFDDALPERKRAGFVAQGVMRGVDDVQLVAVWLAVTDVESAKGYFDDRSLRERMTRAGLVGRPQVQLSSNVSAAMEPGRTGLSAAILALEVDDFAPFKMAFDAQAEERTVAGIVGYALSQDVDDAHLAYVYLQGEEPTSLQAYVSAKQTRQRWRDAGVRGNPTVTLVREDELSLCQ